MPLLELLRVLPTQGTINGYGERTGNCDNTVVEFTLKMGIETCRQAY